MIEEHISVEDRAALGAIARRRDLEHAEVYRRHAGAIDRLTFAVARGRAQRAAPQPERRFIRLVAWNIERGKAAADICAYLRGTSVLRQCDILLLNEVDMGMARSDNRDVAADIAEALGFEYVFGNSYLCLSSGNDRDGDVHTVNEHGLHGNAILSRFPLVRGECFSLPVSKDKFHSKEKRLGHKKALWAEVDTPLGRLPVCAVHLDSGASPAQRARQLRGVLDVLRQRGVDERCVIGGDFNTNTYDTKNVPRLLWNIAAKMVRGGFPHAVHHYLHPHKLYEKAMFDELDRYGFAYAPFNAPAQGTTRYEVGTHDSESKVRDYLPGFAVDILRWRLRPWDGVVGLKIDWFAGRGVRVLDAGQVTDGDGPVGSGAEDASAGAGAGADAVRHSIAPLVLEKPLWQGRWLSDHDPIIVDVDF